MKRFIVALALLFATTASAGSLQGSAVVDPQSTAKNPVSGGLAMESDYWSRVGLQFSAERHVSANVDLIGRSLDTGFVFGVGLVADDISAPLYFQSSTEHDTTVVNRPHDNGKHKGDKHKRPGKQTVSISGRSLYVSVGGMNLDFVPSAFIGLSADRGLFVESRVLFDDEITNRVSVGLRW